MKALKEKRISLRSLWRMGLVVLSVFALAFVACGKSDSGDPSSPTVPGGLTSTVVPVEFTIDEKPIASAGDVYEGQIVNLAGIKLNVRTSDGNWAPTTDLTKIKVDPAVYLFGTNNLADGYMTELQQYKITYTDNGVTLERYVPRDYLGTHKRLLDLDVTGQMLKQEYLIDEIPDYTGLTVFGVYSASNTPSAEQSDYKRLPIPLSTDIKEHRWAWVWNATSGIGSFTPNDNPGVLISIGSFGGILSDIKGSGSTATTNSWLQGKRIEITRLHQVKGLAWDPEPAYPNAIYYDDPRLIGQVYDSQLLSSVRGGIFAGNSDWQKVLQAVETWQNTWFDEAFVGAKIKVTYTNDDTRTYNLRDIRTMNTNYGYDLRNNLGQGGSWANLDFSPITRTNKKIDITKDSKYVITDANTTTVDFDATNYPGAWGAANYDFVPITGQGVGGDGVIVGDGGWSQWAQLSQDYTRVRFYWRGYTLDTTVKLYNRPLSMAVSVKEGYASPPLIMSGEDYVYQRPEGMAAFFGKLKVSVTYMRQGGAESDTKTREDVGADIAAGKCRASIPIPTASQSSANWNSPSDGVNVASIPTLYSTNVFNWKEANDLFPQLARLVAPDGTYYTKYTVAQNSILNKTASDNYVNRDRQVAARIEFRGFSGNPLTTRTVNNREILVGVRGYSQDPDPDGKNLP